jgi:hypothetical protein
MLPTESDSGPLVERGGIRLPAYSCHRPGRVKGIKSEVGAVELWS